MQTVRCTAPFCSGGFTPTGPCLLCKGTGWVKRKEYVASPGPYDCPYGACGGKCRGKGYYLYSGVRIDCSIGRI